MSSGMVGFSTVAPALIRPMLPQGVMQLATTLTIQAPGVATFSTPLEVTFANVYGAAAGTQLDVYSFNHTTGLLEITGTATVSADGASVTTDPGCGITHPGWFGVTPPGTTCQETVDPTKKPTEDVAPDLVLNEDAGAGTELASDESSSSGGISADAIVPHIHNVLFLRDGASDSITIDNAAVVAAGGNAEGTPAVIQFTVDGPAGSFVTGIPTSNVMIPPAQRYQLSLTALDLLEKANGTDAIYGAVVHVTGWEEGFPDTILLDQTFSVARFVYATTELANGNFFTPGGAPISMFPKTLVASNPDGTPYFHTKTVNFHLPSDVGTKISLQGTNAGMFSLSGTPASSGASSVLMGDGTATWSFSPRVSQISPSLTKNALLGIQVGTNKSPLVQLQGYASLPVSIGIGMPQFEAQLITYLSTASNFANPGTAGQATAAFVEAFAPLLPNAAAAPGIIQVSNVVSALGLSIKAAVQKIYMQADPQQTGIQIIFDGGSAPIMWQPDFTADQIKSLGPAAAPGCVSLHRNEKREDRRPECRLERHRLNAAHSDRERGFLRERIWSEGSGADRLCVSTDGLKLLFGRGTADSGHLCNVHCGHHCARDRARVRSR